MLRVPSRTMSTNLSWMLSWTSTRVPHVQTWPEAPQTAAIDVADAVSRSASGNTMNGLLPPSSRLTRLTRLAAAAWMALPVGHGAGERQGVDERVLDERGARRRAVALHDVEHAGRDPGLERQLRHDAPPPSASARPA